jgi:hypothetical protein
VPKKSRTEKPVKEIAQHTIKLPLLMDKRVITCMKLEGIQSFADFARSALSRRCLEVERFHGVPTKTD